MLLPANIIQTVNEDIQRKINLNGVFLATSNGTSSAPLYCRPSECTQDASFQLCGFFVIAAKMLLHSLSFLRLSAHHLLRAVFFSLPPLSAFLSDSFCEVIAQFLCKCQEAEMNVSLIIRVYSLIGQCPQCGHSLEMLSLNRASFPYWCFTLRFRRAAPLSGGLFRIARPFNTITTFALTLMMPSCSWGLLQQFWPP